VALGWSVRGLVAGHGLAGTYPLGVLEKRRETRLPTVAQAAASPTAIVLAGAGVAVGELAHLGLVVAIVFGGVAYGRESATPPSTGAWLSRAGPAAGSLGLTPGQCPSPWRSYTTRALEARKRYRQLAADCPPGPVADYLANSVAKVDAATEEHWALAKSGAGLVDPPGRTERAAKSLEEVQAELLQARGANRAQLESREAELASQLRSFRHLELVRRADIEPSVGAECPAGGRGRICRRAVASAGAGRRRPVHPSPS